MIRQIIRYNSTIIYLVNTNDHPEKRMLAEVGSILIGLSFFSILYAAFAVIYGLKKQDFRWQISARNAIFSSNGLLAAALLLLVTAFVTDQFQLHYVYSHSSLSLPLTLKLSALWAGQEGSLLLGLFCRCCSLPCWRKS